MTSLKNIYVYTKLLTQLELRKAYSIGGNVLFIFTTVFIIQKLLSDISNSQWNTIFWIVYLFISLNSMVKSFSGIDYRRALYKYQVLSAYEALLSKILYNFIYLFLMTIVQYAAFFFFLSNPILLTGHFLLVILLAVSGISIIFTFVAGIASSDTPNSTLMAILSFPVVIPVLLTIVILSSFCMAENLNTEFQSLALLLGGINLVFLSMSIILFPFIWKS